MNYDNGVVGPDLLGILVFFGPDTAFCISPTSRSQTNGCKHRLLQVVVHLTCFHIILENACFLEHAHFFIKRERVAEQSHVLRANRIRNDTELRFVKYKDETVNHQTDTDGQLR